MSEVSSTLKKFKVQHVNNQASDHPGSYMLFAHVFTLFQAIAPAFEIALPKI